MKTPREQFDTLTESQETQKQKLIGVAQLEAIKINKNINKVIEQSGVLTPQIIVDCKQAKADLEDLFKKYNIDENVYRESLDYMVSQEFFDNLSISNEQMKKNAKFIEELEKLGNDSYKIIRQHGNLTTRLCDDDYSSTDHFTLFNETLSNGVWLMEYYPRENKYRIHQVVVGKVDSTVGNPDFDYEINVFKTGNKLMNEFKKSGFKTTAGMTDEYVEINFAESTRTDISGIQKIFELLKKHEITFEPKN